MGDGNKTSKVEAKLKNIRVNKDISLMQNEVNTSAKMKQVAHSTSVRTIRDAEGHKIRVAKRIRVKEEIEATHSSTKTLHASKRKLKFFSMTCNKKS